MVMTQENLQNVISQRKIIFLTGDVHHMSMAGKDQKFMLMTEVEAAQKYVKIAAQYDVKVTLFISGKSFEEEPQNMSNLLRYENLEIGGHTWNCFRPLGLHRFFQLAFGSFYGPSFLQRWDVNKTVSIIESFAKKKCFSWRTHWLLGEETTNIILKENGMQVVSDDLDPDGKLKVTESGLISLPINTIPDHNHIYHGFKSREFVASKNFIRDNLGLLTIFKLGHVASKFELEVIFKETIKRVLHTKTKSLPFENRFWSAKEWLTLNKRYIKNNISRNGFATILAHPGHMELIDGMKTFKQLCAFISQYNTLFVSDILNL